MAKEVPYYILDDEGNVEGFSSNGEAYIDDNDLKELLIDFLGDDVSAEEIQKILDAVAISSSSRPWMILLKSISPPASNVAYISSAIFLSVSEEKSESSIFDETTFESFLFLQATPKSLTSFSKVWDLSALPAVWITLIFGRISTSLFSFLYSVAFFRYSA